MNGKRWNAGFYYGPPTFATISLGRQSI